jgi:hypothetical protein
MATMTPEEVEEAHMLVMNIIKPYAVRGSDSVIFWAHDVEYELETLLEVVVFINKYMES